MLSLLHDETTLETLYIPIDSKRTCFTKLWYSTILDFSDSQFLSSSAALLCRSNASVTRTTSLLFQTPVSSVFVRGFAGEKKKGKKQAAAPAQETVKSDSLIPINIYVDGKDPEVLPDDQYPEWLWHMLDPKVTPDEWETRNYEGITEKDMQAYWKRFVFIVG
ncbi:uncharacterized protein [Blastocystis hominis]|uniref:Large ribosomal subunit protein mL54 n=1 Tax=Blastocystis hominis TaxID=12968 RepID=D8M1S8_BLAHO|nr:uncharacterized protein [Blastocystis hominis]CBK22017.2 unnamed protein product [Blastocystis hominis]|eukprot:XP_012896065.1 uncharacterized protein [Blastocystis hominis]